MITHAYALRSLAGLVLRWGRRLSDGATTALASKQVELVDLHLNGRQLEELMRTGRAMLLLGRQRRPAPAADLGEPGACEVSCSGGIRSRLWELVESWFRRVVNSLTRASRAACRCSAASDRRSRAAILLRDALEPSPLLIVELGQNLWSEWTGAE